MKKAPAFKAHAWIVGSAALAIFIGAVVVPHAAATRYDRGKPLSSIVENIQKHIEEPPKLDTEAYDKKMRYLAHVEEASTTSTSTPKGLWPVTDAPYPNVARCFHSSESSRTTETSTRRRWAFSANTTKERYLRS
jgi:hypothetical protein